VEGKLIRDKIPQIIKEAGGIGQRYHVADRDEYRQRLFEKMREELDEFVEEPCLEEAADMYEVFVTILKEHNLDLAEVMFKSYDKKEARGGFRERIVLENVPKERQKKGSDA
jgi:predicted house-cleaning noncanonical NTP pyrophosphatase (MazG superfamily)